MPSDQAQAACSWSERVERKLWRWRRSIQALYLPDRVDVSQLVGQVAMQDEAPPLTVLADVVGSGALVPNWQKLDRWAAAHGVQLWPDEEGANDDDTDD